MQRVHLAPRPLRTLAAGPRRVAAVVHRGRGAGALLRARRRGRGLLPDRHQGRRPLDRQGLPRPAGGGGHRPSPPLAQGRVPRPGGYAHPGTARLRPPPVLLPRSGPRPVAGDRRRAPGPRPDDLEPRDGPRCRAHGGPLHPCAHRESHRRRPLLRARYGPGRGQRGGAPRARRRARRAAGAAGPPPRSRAVAGARAAKTPTRPPAAPRRGRRRRRTPAPPRGCRPSAGGRAGATPARGATR